MSSIVHPVSELSFNLVNINQIKVIHTKFLSSIRHLNTAATLQMNSTEKQVKKSASVWNYQRLFSCAGADLMKTLNVAFFKPRYDWKKLASLKDLLRKQIVIIPNLAKPPHPLFLGTVLNTQIRAIVSCFDAKGKMLLYWDLSTILSTLVNIYEPYLC